MSAYRGVKMPSPSVNQYGAVINDGHYGYFHAHSRDAVEREWRAAVDSELFDEAINNQDNYSRNSSPGTDGTLSECLRCGSVVSNPFAHNEWHSRIEGCI